MAQFIWGRVTAKPGIASVSGHEVRFVDGSSGRYDTVIAATGHEVALPSDLATGRVGLPDSATMQADIQRERARIKALCPDSPRYGLELDPAEYRASLARERRRAARAVRTVAPAH